MNPTPITTAARAALRPAGQHLFGLVPSVPPETIRALREWVEAITTASAIAEQIGYGVDEIGPHVDDACQLAQEWRQSSTITLTPALSLRLAYAAAVIDSLMQYAPHEVVVACAMACETLETMRR